MAKSTNGITVASLPAASTDVPSPADELALQTARGMNGASTQNRVLDTATAYCNEMAASLKETAAQYRDEAKRVFLQIENCSLLTAEVRKTCAEMKERIATPATVELTPQEINAEPRKKAALRKIPAATEAQP